jgi:hypothetical protein
MTARSFTIKKTTEQLLKQYSLIYIAVVHGIKGYKI